MTIKILWVDESGNVYVELSEIKILRWVIFVVTYAKYYSIRVEACIDGY